MNPPTSSLPHDSDNHIISYHILPSCPSWLTRSKASRAQNAGRVLAEDLETLPSRHGVGGNLFDTEVAFAGCFWMRDHPGRDGTGRERSLYAL
jgi:hypothetical protein